jgi:hypothetical protein
MTPLQKAEILHALKSLFGDYEYLELIRVLEELEASVVADKQEIARLRTLLNRDHTGLAEGLAAVERLTNGYSWILDGEWGSYDYTQRTMETLRKEIGFCLDSIRETTVKYLKQSGKVAHEAFNPHHTLDYEIVDCVATCGAVAPVAFYSQPLPDVGRCKDCKHAEPDKLADNSPGYCCLLDGGHYVDTASGQRQRVWPIHPPNWFCADFKQRTDKDKPHG